MLPYAVVRGRWRLSAGGRGEFVAKLRGCPVAVLGQRLGAGGGPRAPIVMSGSSPPLTPVNSFPSARYRLIVISIPSTSCLHYWPERLPCAV
jgi:hypothetical protein